MSNRLKKFPRTLDFRRFNGVVVQRVGFGFRVAVFRVGLLLLKTVNNECNC